MRIIPNRTLYACDYCSKHRLTKAAMQRHEVFCRHNPNNRHMCFGCDFLVVQNEPVGIGADGELQRSGHQLFTCAKKKVNMFTYVAERRNIVEKLGEVVRMPLACDWFTPEVYYNTEHPENPSPTPF